MRRTSSFRSALVEKTIESLGLQLDESIDSVSSLPRQNWPIDREMYTTHRGIYLALTIIEYYRADE
jgi:hypothetical protein